MVCEPSFESTGAIQRPFCGATCSEVVFFEFWWLFISSDILPKLKLSDFNVVNRCRVFGDNPSPDKLIDEFCLARSWWRCWIVWFCCADWLPDYALKTAESYRKGLMLRAVCWPDAGVLLLSMP